MYIAKIRVNQHTCSLAKATENGQVSMELLEYILMNDEEALFLGRISRMEGNPRECFDIIENHESTKFFQILEKTKTSLDFLAVIRDTTGIKAFEESYCFIKPPIIVENGNKLYTVYAPEISLLRRAYEKLKRVGNWEVIEVKSIDSKGVRLTERQYAILKTAYEMGYFDRRRKVKLEDIASVMNLSKSAVHKHLQEGICRLVAKYFRSEEFGEGE
ncbi:putative DNA binding protein [Geoglobus ahangari]|uniref:Putative DNA binding protein n=1 Tax=Geoglobus ahangari TaxID=113653 RepID=A0A0F7IE56_9EURY|nr:helix-turn-helix domain-containing protein [Geoglobus ahangari]AKG91222.1 putative DNA binding protein [Geoglobus ahangari]